MAKKSQKDRKDISNIIDFFRDKKVQFICGVVLFFIMVYISLALVSFVYTGKNDQSVLAEYKAKKIEYNHLRSQRPLSDEDKDNLRLIRRELQEIQKKAENAEISERAVDLRGILDAIGLVSQGLTTGQALEMCVTGKTFDRYEQQLIRDTVAARIPQDIKSAEMFES